MGAATPPPSTTATSGLADPAAASSIAWARIRPPSPVPGAMATTLSTPGSSSSARVIGPTVVGSFSTWAVPSKGFSTVVAAKPGDVGAELLVGPLAQRRYRGPALLGAVGGHRPGAARLGPDGDVAAGRQAALRGRGGQLEQVAQVVRLDHAVLATDRLKCRVR